MKKLYDVLIVMMVMILFLVGCSEKQGQENQGSKIHEEKTQEDVVLKLGSIHNFEKSKEGKSLIFDTLTKIDHQYEPIPGIVDSWEVSEDKKTYKLTFRSNVKYHDGTIVNADDIVYSIVAGGKNRYCSYTYFLDSVSKTEDNRIEIQLNSPYIYMIQDLAKLPLVKQDGWSEEGMITNMIGTGPFIFESTDAGEVTTLVKNKDYWNADYMTDVDIIKWHSIPDEQTRKMALISGQVDVLGLSEHYISMPYTVINEIKENDDFTVMSEGKEDYTSVGCINFNWKKGTTSNLNLRRAFLYLFNREELVRDIFFDIPEPIGHVYNPKYADGPTQAPFEYDPAKAKKYLEEAGYSVGDELHPTVDKDGKPLALELLYGNEEYEEDLAMYLVNVAKEFGIELTPLRLDWTGKSEKFHAGNYEMVIGHPWFVPLVDSLGYMGLTDEYTDYGLGYAINEEMKEVGSAFLEATTKEELKEYAQKIWEIQYDQAVCVPLFADLRYMLHNGKFKNLHFDANVFQIDLNGVVIK